MYIKIIINDKFRARFFLSTILEIRMLGVEW